MEIWNPWHGCHKISEGCLNCYMFRRDSMYDKDSNIVTKTSTFNAPVKRSRGGSYKMQESGTVYSCMTSDFFIEEADEWRKEAWLLSVNAVISISALSLNVSSVLRSAYLTTGETAIIT